MNRDSRKKLAEMILDKSRLISAQSNVKLTFVGGELKIVDVGGYRDDFDVGVDAKVIGYFKELGFERADGRREVEESTPWQATPLGEGPHLLFKPDGDVLYFGVTTPLAAESVTVMKIDRETAEKILVLGLP